MIILAGVYYGLKSGLIGASLSVIGFVASVWLAGQLSDDIGEVLTDSISNDTAVTVISYASIFVVVMMAASIAQRILRSIIRLAFLGWLDKLGGVAAGVLVGAMLAGAVITGMARLTYNFEIPLGGLPQQAIEKVLPIVEAKDWLEESLVNSGLVERFIDITDAISADALGFVSSDFEMALDILEARIDEDNSGEGSIDTTPAEDRGAASAAD